MRYIYLKNLKKRAPETNSNISAINFAKNPQIKNLKLPVKNPEIKAKIKQTDAKNTTAANTIQLHLYKLLL